MKRKPPALPRNLRHGVLARDGRICWICGQPGATTVDHVIPRSQGGPDTAANLRAAHQHCNYRRGAALPPAPVVTRRW